MSIFDRGILWVEQSAGGPLLRYHLTSKALLYCFLAPLLFLAFAQLAVFINTLEAPSAEAAAKAAEAEKAKEKKDKVQPLHPIDAFLGAPAPEDPDKKKDKKEDDEGELSPTPAYVFAGLFAALFLVGRFLEAWLVKRLFRKRLQLS